MAKLPTFSSADFNWKSGKGSSALGKLGLNDFPKGGFYIRSTRTQQVQLFLPDSVGDAEHEFYDGEARGYFVPGGGFQVTIWVGDAV